MSTEYQICQFQIKFCSCCLIFSFQNSLPKIDYHLISNIFVPRRRTSHYGGHEYIWKSQYLCDLESLRHRPSLPFWSRKVTYLKFPFALSKKKNKKLAPKLPNTLFALIPFPFSNLHTPQHRNHLNLMSMISSAPRVKRPHGPRALVTRSRLERQPLRRAAGTLRYLQHCVSAL